MWLLISLLAILMSPLVTIYIFLFLLHIGRQAAGDTASSSPDVAGGSADGVTATADSAAGTGMDVASIRGLSDDVDAGGDVARATDITAGESVVTAGNTADDTHATGASPRRAKRKRTYGSAQATPGHNVDIVSTITHIC